MLCEILFGKVLVSCAFETTSKPHVAQIVLLNNYKNKPSLLLIFGYNLLRMKGLIFIAACFYTVAGFGQTKLISFRSHSGNNANFRTAVEHNLFDIGSSNFGIVSRIITKIDTVMLVSKDAIVVVRKLKIEDPQTGKFRTTYRRDTYTREESAYLFNGDSSHNIKSTLNGWYHSGLDSTVFIGFDKKIKQKRNNQQPIKTHIK